MKTQDNTKRIGRVRLTAQIIISLLVLVTGALFAYGSFKGGEVLGGILGIMIVVIILIFAIFVSPSDSETQGLTFIEAMACNLPVVGVDSGGVKDVIQNGENGFLAKPNDSVSLAFQIKTLLDKKELAKKIIKSNRQLVKEYSIYNTTQKLLKLYGKIKVKKGMVK